MFIGEEEDMDADGKREKRRLSTSGRLQWMKQLMTRCLVCILVLSLPYYVFHTRNNRVKTLLSTREYSKVILPQEYHGKFESIHLNRTLGFQKIYVLNVPKRVDRRDMMSLMALASNVEIEYVTGVDSEAISSLRLPPIQLIDGLRNMNFQFSPGQLGCYRSNLNIMRKIVDEKVTSALIIQDDVDWDEDLFDSLERLQGKQAL